MKKTILFIFLIIPVFVFAQEPTKNQIKNAEKITNYVARPIIDEEANDFNYYR